MENNVNNMFTDMLVNLKVNTTLLNPDEVHKGDDGHYVCNNCNTPRECFVPYVNQWMPCLCECLKEKKAKEEQAMKENQLALRNKENTRLLNERLQDISIIGKEHLNAYFSKTEIHSNDNFEYAFNKCKEYCDKSSKLIEQGRGIYLYGDNGTGKSHLAVCIAREIRKQGYSVVFTNFGEIGNYIRGTFNDYNMSEYSFMKDIENVDLLIIDDFGTELVVRNGQDAWLQEKVFNIVNKRYNKCKSMIFTSNYSLKDLTNERGLMKKTIERIAEKCKPLKLNGRSYRLQKVKQQEDIF